jgi:hypothetical protein
MRHVLAGILLVIAAPVGICAVPMMIYTLSKSMAAPTVAENRAWKRRYYRYMGLFLLAWVMGCVAYMIDR